MAKSSVRGQIAMAGYFKPCPDNSSRVRGAKRPNSSNHRNIVFFVLQKEDLNAKNTRQQKHEHLNTQFGGLLQSALLSTIKHTSTILESYERTGKMCALAGFKHDSSTNLEC